MKRAGAEKPAIPTPVARRGQAHFRSRTAIELPAILILLLEARVVRFVGLWMRDLAELLSTPNDQSGCKQFHFYGPATTFAQALSP
jgi:hypothetical protein